MQLAEGGTMTRPSAKPSPASRQLVALVAYGVPPIFATLSSAAEQVSAPAAAAVQRNGSTLAESFAAIRSHFADLAAASPAIPSELARIAVAIAFEVQAFGLFRLILLLGVFVAAGLAAERIFRRLTAPVHSWLAAVRVDTVAVRLAAIAANLTYRVTSPLVFGLGTISAFLVFSWPPLLSQTVLGLLAVVVVYRVARAVLEFILSPAGSAGFGDGLRVLPVSDLSAEFWVQRLSYAIGWFAAGTAIIGLFGVASSPLPVRQLLAYALGTILLGLGIDAVWRRPAESSTASANGRVGDRVKNWLLSICFGLLWFCWVAGAAKAFWVLAVAVGLPAACFVAQQGVNNVLRAPGAALGGRMVPGLLAAIVERGVRAALIIGAVMFLADRLGMDFILMTAQDTMLTRTVRGGLSAIVIVLAADFLWHVIRTAPCYPSCAMSLRSPLLRLRC